MAKHTTKKQTKPVGSKPNSKQSVQKPVEKKIELKFKFNMQNLGKWLLVVFALFFFIVLFVSPVNDEAPLSKVLQDIQNKKVNSLSVEGDVITAIYKDETQVLTRKEPLDTAVAILQDAGIKPTAVELTIKNQSGLKTLGSILELLLPVILTAVIFFFIFRQMRGAQDSVFSFGKNKAKVFMKGKQNIRFKDVGGVDEVKQELEEIVDFLKHPKKYQQLGAKTPKGVLLVGPAGTGKTLLARAVAGEAGVPFLSMAGSEFMEMLVGVGASRVRDLFETAKKASPAIIFIDEIDAIGRQRGTSLTGGHDEREQTLNQILVEMDGFTPRDNVIVLAATNRGDLLDNALLRPGRFDRRVYLDLPDIEGRQNILHIHAQGKPFVKDIKWNMVARRTVGFSGADLENMLNEAAINAARANRKEINYGDIEEAATKVKLGPQKRRLQSDEEKRMTAYHEAGHAVCAFYMKYTDPVHRVSIISRSMTLGQTEVPPERDKYQETRSELLDKAVMLLGGRAAEELEFKEMTGGASSDIEQVTKIARAMVVDYGMSALGPINLSSQSEQINYRRGTVIQSDLSEAMQSQVDTQMKKIVDEAYQRALKTLKGHKSKLDAVAAKLIEKETLEREDFEAIMKKKTV
ncbi:ATP-dependent zinc metalloprotease FtsH [Candidatus Beckwithbacteria bacterium]|nr:ATP-dependent zinc metalloprotease FtsH [Candidatus Beckwithbacteria bacterium]